MMRTPPTDSQIIIIYNVAMMKAPHVANTRVPSSHRIHDKQQQKSSKTTTGRTFATTEPLKRMCRRHSFPPDTGIPSLRGEWNLLPPGGSRLPDVDISGLQLRQCWCDVKNAVPDRHCNGCITPALDPHIIKIGAEPTFISFDTSTNTGTRYQYDTGRKHIETSVEAENEDSNAFNIQHQLIEAIPSIK